MSIWKFIINRFLDLQKYGKQESNKWNNSNTGKTNTEMKKSLCIEDFQKQKITWVPYPKFTLFKSELDNFKNIMNINSFCLPQELGQFFRFCYDK